MAGGEVIHSIDRFHDQEPWDREEELIRLIGQLKHGTGPLTNEQDYSRSVKVNGVEVRKYAADHVDDTERIPAKFKLRDVRLAQGQLNLSRAKACSARFTQFLRHILE